MVKGDMKTQTNGTLFQYDAPSAKRVFLAGTFNNWDPQATPMQKSKDGSWRAQLGLSPGRYEYKFIVDGCWCCEPGADDSALPDCVPNGLGTVNRMIEITEV